MTTEPEVPVTMHIAEGVTPPAVMPPASVPIEREAEGGTIETTERPLSQREIAMQEIAKRRAVAIEKELAYGEDMADRAREDAGQTALVHAKRTNPAEYDDSPAENQTHEPGASAAPATPEPAAVQQAKTEAPAQADTRQVITIGNQQYRVTPEELQRLASIGAVALDAMHRQQSQPVQQQNPQPQQQRPQQAPQQQQQRVPQALLTPEETRALAPRLQSYNEHESAAALQDLTQLIAARMQAANPQVNPQALANYAVQQATQQMRQEQALNNNLAVIGQEFPDVFSSNRVAQLAAITLHENRRRDAMLGIQKSDLDAYREACNDVVQDLNLRPAAPQPGQGTTQSAPSQAGTVQQQAQPASRHEAKRAAPRSPIPAQRVMSSPQQGQRFPTASEIVQKMKQQRGQVI